MSDRLLYVVMEDGEETWGYCDVMLANNHIDYRQVRNQLIR